MNPGSQQCKQATGSGTYIWCGACKWGIHSRQLAVWGKKPTHGSVARTATLPGATGTWVVGGGFVAAAWGIDRMLFQLIKGDVVQSAHMGGSEHHGRRSPSLSDAREAARPENRNKYKSTRGRTAAHAKGGMQLHDCALVCVQACMEAFVCVQQQQDWPPCPLPLCCAAPRMLGRLPSSLLPTCVGMGRIQTRV